MGKSIDYVEKKLVINKTYLQIYGHSIRIKCNDEIIYEGEIEKYNPIEIKDGKCKIILYIMINGDCLFFDKYFIQNSILNVESKKIEEFYDVFFRKVEEYING